MVQNSPQVTADGEVVPAIRRIEEASDAEGETSDAEGEPSDTDGKSANTDDESVRIGDEPAAIDEAPVAAIRRVEGHQDGAVTPAIRRISGTPAPDQSDDPGQDVPRDGVESDGSPAPDDIPDDVREYERFSKIDGATYERANEFLRDRTYITAREWAMARLCADFRTETGVEMTKIGENLPELVPFMTDTYSPQAVNQARTAFEQKVRKAGATFLYGAMCDFFTAEELDDLMYEVTEVAKFLLEVEGVELSVEEELAAEDRISSVMREVRQSSAALRHDEVTCPECGHTHTADD